MDIQLTKHAALRCVQRQITIDDIQEVIANGRCVKTQENACIIQHKRLGIVMADDGTIITLFRNYKNKTKRGSRYRQQQMRKQLRLRKHDRVW